MVESTIPERLGYSGKFFTRLDESDVTKFGKLGVVEPVEVVDPQKKEGQTEFGVGAGDLGSAYGIES